MVVIVIVVVFETDCASGAQPWTRRKRFGTCLVVKLCVVSLQHVRMRRLCCLSKAARYIRYILVPQKSSKITLPQKLKPTL